MKITKRQLRRIIKEEKAKVLSEGLSHEENLDNAITEYVNDLADQRGVARLELKADVLDFVEGWFEYEEEVSSPRGRRQPGGRHQKLHPSYATGQGGQPWTEGDPQ